jgi:hypothetical protein
MHVARRHVDGQHAQVACDGSSRIGAGVECDDHHNLFASQPRTTGCASQGSETRTDGFFLFMCRDHDADHDVIPVSG